jgi:hypothetical protein
MSFYTGTQAELIYSLTGSVTKNTYTTAAAITGVAGTNTVCAIPAGLITIVEARSFRNDRQHCGCNVCCHAQHEHHTGYQHNEHRSIRCYRSHSCGHCSLVGPRHLQLCRLQHFQYYVAGERCLASGGDSIRCSSGSVGPDRRLPGHARWRPARHAVPGDLRYLVGISSW